MVWLDILCIVLVAYICVAQTKIAFLLCFIKRQSIVKKERPVNLDLSTIQFPAAAKASILHRVSGVVMLCSLVFLMWAFAVSLSGPEGFAQVESIMTSFIAKFIGWGILTALGFHLIIGLRHLVMDMGYWEELDSGRTSATVSIALSVILSVLVGVWLW